MGLACAAGVGVVLILVAMVVVWMVGRRSPRTKWILIALGLLLALALGGNCLASVWRFA